MAKIVKTCGKLVVKNIQRENSDSTTLNYCLKINKKKKKEKKKRKKKEKKKKKKRRRNIDNFQNF